MIKDLIPKPLRPAARRLQVGARRASKVVRSVSIPAPTGTVLTDAAIADAHTLTFLISASGEVAQLKARLSFERGFREFPLNELHRYQQDGRWFVLTSLVLDEPIRAGEKISLACDRGDVSTSWVTIRATADKTHPLIDRLVLTNSKGVLGVAAGKPRTIDGPVLLGVTWDAESDCIRVEADVILVSARLHVRETDTYEPLPVAASGFEVPAEMLMQAARDTEVEASLFGLFVTSGAKDEMRIGHRNPWIRSPRNYETFAPILFRREGQAVSVRPYWTLGGLLGLKVRSN